MSNGSLVSSTASIEFLLEIPPLPGQTTSPADIDGNGLYEDVNGDGQLTISDVQALFENLDSDVVQNNPAAFDFSGTGGRVSIFDVQALFYKYSRQS